MIQSPSPPRVSGPLLFCSHTSLCCWHPSSHQHCTQPPPPYTFPVPTQPLHTSASNVHRRLLCLPVSLSILQVLILSLSSGSLDSAQLMSNLQLTILFIWFFFFFLYSVLLLRSIQRWFCRRDVSQWCWCWEQWKDAIACTESPLYFFPFPSALVPSFSSPKSLKGQNPGKRSRHHRCESHTTLNSNEWIYWM